MRLPDERHDGAARGGFVEHDLGVAGCDDLRVLRLRDIGNQVEGLPLSKNLEVRVGFVQKKNGMGVRVEMRQEQQGLL